MEVMFQMRKNTHSVGFKKGETKNNRPVVVLSDYHFLVSILVAFRAFLS